MRGCIGHQGSVRRLAGDVRGIGDGRWTGSLTTLGSNPGSLHSHWFPLGSNLPHHCQTRAPVQGPITPSGFPWGAAYLIKARQVREMSSAGYNIHLGLHLVTVCTFVFTGFPLIREIREKFDSLFQSGKSGKRGVSGTIREKVCQTG